MSSRVVVLTSAAIASSLISTAAVAQWTVVNLHPPGAPFTSQALGGGGAQQVGSVQTGATVGSIRASLWSGTSASWINLHPGGDYSFARASDGVQQVGEVFFGSPSHASLWTGSAASWVDLNPAGVADSAAFGVEGGTQVGRALVLAYHACKWNGTAASFVDLNPPPVGGFGFRSEAFAIGGGVIVGYVEGTAGIHAAIFTGAGGWTDLHPAGNISSWIYGTDGAQFVGVVRVPDTSSHAALWNSAASAWIDLHPVATANSRATDVLMGTQVGYVQATPGSPFKASLWTGTAASRVDLHAFLPASFANSYAESIWLAAGHIYVAGSGFNTATARQESVLWSRPVPCRPDLTTTAVAGTPGYGVPNGVLNTDDFFYYLTQFAAGNLAVADMTTTAVPGAPGYGTPNGVLNNDDFFFYLGLFAMGC